MWRIVAVYCPTFLVPQPLHAIVPGEQLSPDVQAFYVLSGPNLQKWALDGDTERVGGVTI